MVRGWGGRGLRVGELRMKETVILVVNGALDISNITFNPICAVWFAFFPRALITSFRKNLFDSLALSFATDFFNHFSLC